MIIVLSFIIGAILFLVKPVSIGSGLENFFYGGAFGFVVFGLPAIITGSTDQKWVDSLKGINLKSKHSMFLSLVSMTMAGIVSILGTAVGHIIHYDLFVNSILFGCVLAFAFNILVIWSTTRMRLYKSVLISILQPLIMIGMFIITSFLNNIVDIYELGIIGTIFKVIIASIIDVGVSETLTSTVPIYYAKHDYVNLNHLIKNSLIITMGFAIIFTGFIWIWPEGFLAPYNFNEIDITDFVINALRLYSLFFLTSLLPSLLIFYYEAIEISAF